MTGMRERDEVSLGRRFATAIGSSHTQVPRSEGMRPAFTV